jgi:hypothetical protein
MTEKERLFVREPHVAGTFYPAAPVELEGMLDRCLPAGGATPARVFGAMLPHAGYIYSGRCAGEGYARIEVPATALVLAPNHTGRGARLSLWPAPGVWRVPGGAVPVDAELCERLLAKCPGLVPDTGAHATEHAAEVHLPFLRRLRPDIAVACAVIGTHDPQAIERVGAGVAEAIAELGREVLVVASSDLNHYEDQERTLVKDRYAIDEVLGLDPAKLLATCEERDVSMCGVAPTAVLLAAARATGGRRRAELVDHRTSGDVFGDYDRVVGYASILVH